MEGGDATPMLAAMADTGPAASSVPLFAQAHGKKRNLLGLAESAPGSPTMGPTPGSGMAWHALSAGCAAQLFCACDPTASRTTNRSRPIFPRSASPIAQPQFTQSAKGSPRMPGMTASDVIHHHGKVYTHEGFCTSDPTAAPDGWLAPRDMPKRRHYGGDGGRLAPAVSLN